MREVVIVAAKRTALGSFQGSLADISAPKLGAIAIKAALAASGLKADQVDEVIMGNVLTASVGQAPARQAAIHAGLSNATPCLTIGKVCGSGLKAVMLADQIIRSGDAEVIIAGGMENMSMAPYALDKARTGYRMGDGKITDLMVKDGLCDAYQNLHMGVLADKCAAEYKITREDQDKFSAESYTRALKAIESKRFVDEIVPVEIPQRKGDPVLFMTDEEPGKGNVSKLSALKAAFGKEGSVTAGNASSINDGAAALVVMSADRAKALGLKPLAKIIAQGQASHEPEWFTTAPAVAMEKALKKAGLRVSDIDLWEVNEAFAVVSIYNNNKLGIPADKCNVNGGAVALGHPIGASGARILVSLIHELQKRPEAKRGLASLCIGGGEGVALIIEKM